MFKQITHFQLKASDSCTCTEYGSELDILKGEHKLKVKLTKDNGGNGVVSLKH